jgi:hypothetical protein
VQTVFGFGFEEHGQSVAATLAREEYLIAVEFQRPSMRGHNYVPGGAAGPA